jgi:ElaB/YqjD/DUF883 family membrane-anchored ribosome-binding protein
VLAKRLQSGACGIDIDHSLPAPVLASQPRYPHRIERAQAQLQLQRYASSQSEEVTSEEVMDPNKNEAMRGPEAMKNAMAGNGPGGASVTNSLARGKDAVGAAAADATDQAAVDLKTLRNDLNNLTDTVMKFISQAGNEAAKSAREITSNVAGQVGSAAADMADKGANIASATTQQAKTFAAELEGMARRNPLGAVAGAVMVGVLIGMLGRRNG